MLLLGGLGSGMTWDIGFEMWWLFAQGFWVVRDIRTLKSTERKNVLNLVP